MSLRLTDQARRREIEVAPGVVFKVRPFTQVMAETSAFWAYRQLAEIEGDKEGRKAALDAVGWEGEIPDLVDPVLQAAVIRSLKTLKLAEIAVIGWSGILDEDDRQVEFSQDNLQRILLLYPDVGTRFYNEYTGLIARLSAAKNAFAPSSDGGLGEGVNTVPDAEKPTSLAQEEENTTGASAPKRSTRPSGKRKSSS